MKIAEGSKWGINLASTVCPTCQNSLSGLRAPRSFRQVMWGGWTCPHCGLEVDKWGKPRK